MHHHVRRTLAATGTTALLAAALLTAPGAQAAAATSCLGKAVTIDGTGQASVTGTPEADVIAASVGASVNALAGADTICVLPGTATTPTTIDAGDGDDAVDTSAVPAGVAVSTLLGAGDDSFAGGAGSDQVATGAGTNSVSTGLGDDAVGSGVAGQPNTDRIDLGAGDDVLTWHGTQQGASTVDLGEGANTLIDNDGGEVGIDATGSTVGRDGSAVLKWKGPAANYVVESNATAVVFKGAAASETFELRDPAVGATPTKVKVDMGAGDDTMTIRSNVLDGSTWNGSDGTDLFQVAYDYGQLLLDLVGGEFETGAPDATPDQKVSNVENVDAITTNMTVKGEEGPNVFNLDGCSITVASRAGADTISIGTDIADAPKLACTTTKMVARGGKDVDTITGTDGDDRLYGNKGADVIDARGGNDVVFGGDDNDVIEGKTGDDKLRGGKGDDEIGGNEGNDRVQGDSGNDRLLGDAGNDTLVGGRGFDRADGGSGFDRAFTVERRRNIERGR